LLRQLFVHFHDARDGIDDRAILGSRAIGAQGDSLLTYGIDLGDMLTDSPGYVAGLVVQVPQGIDGLPRVDCLLAVVMRFVNPPANSHPNRQIDEQNKATDDRQPRNVVHGYASRR
jgi:hypothetical protein